ncbi:hypothetical protein LP7551_01485 [Roseibium album]|nr:hypothetical protein LP7551_01485 [Roseibium album]
MFPSANVRFPPEYRVQRTAPKILDGLFSGIRRTCSEVRLQAGNYTRPAQRGCQLSQSMGKTDSPLMGPMRSFIGRN